MNLQSPVLRNLVRKYPKKFFLSIPSTFNQEPTSPSTPGTPNVVEGLADIPTSPDFESHEEKGHSSRIKLNHPPKVIMVNINELTLRKRTIDKYVANFVSYSCYLS